MIRHRLSGIAAAALLGLSMSAATFADQSNERSDDDRSDASRSCSSGTGDTGNAKRAKNLQVVGLTGDNPQRLVCFSENRPNGARVIGFVSGLSTPPSSMAPPPPPDTRLIGIDFRVQDGNLYGVGDKGGVYIIDTSNAVARRVSQLTIAPDASSSFGVDFNPAADRLRIVSSSGQNLRHNLDSAVGAPAPNTTVADAALNYTGTLAPGIAGSAYTNNDLETPPAGTTGTTLYALDSNLNQVALQSPPNAGSLAATGKLTVDPDDVVGFDVYSTVRDGLTVENRALASLKLGATTGLYSVNLLTGKATPLGSFHPQLPIVDIAIPLNQL